MPTSAFASGRPWQQMVRTCVDQLTVADGRASLGIVFLTDPLAESADEIITALKEATGVAPWIGAVSRSIFAGANEIANEDGLSLAILNIPLSTFKLFDSSFPGTITGHATSALVHAPLVEQLSTSLAALSLRTSALFVGGRGATEGEHGPIVGGPTAGSIAGVMFEGSTVMMGGYSRPLAPIGPEHLVTSSYSDRLLTLDDSPAAAVLADDAGDLLARNRSRLEAKVQLLDLDDGLSGGRLYRLREVKDCLGAIRIEGASRVGSRVRFVQVDATHALDDLSELAAGLKRRLKGRDPKLALYYSSIHRGDALFGPRVSELAILREQLGSIPLLGMRTTDEIFHDAAMQFSGVLCLLA